MADVLTTGAVQVAPNWGKLPEIMTVEQINLMVDLFLEHSVGHSLTAGQDALWGRPSLELPLPYQRGDTLGNAVLAGNFPDGSEEWHAQRKRVIGGSDVASILGLSSFKSRYVLWLEKAGYVVPEPIDPGFAEWGHRLEPVLGEKFLDMFPDYELLVGGSWVNKDRPWHGANPDGLLRHKGAEHPHAILEKKTSRSGYGWEHGRVPKKYIAQVRYYLECFGFEYAYIVVLVALGDYRVYRIPRNPLELVESYQEGELAQMYDAGGDYMLSAAEEFVRLLSANTPPPIDGGKDTLDYFTSSNPDVEKGTELELTAQVRSFLGAKEESEKWEERLREAKSTLLAAMSEGNIQYALEGGVRRVRRQASKGGRVALYAM